MPVIRWSISSNKRLTQMAPLCELWAKISPSLKQTMQSDIQSERTARLGSDMEWWLVGCFGGPPMTPVDGHWAPAGRWEGLWRCVVAACEGMGSICISVWDPDSSGFSLHQDLLHACLTVYCTPIPPPPSDPPPVSRS